MLSEKLKKQTFSLFPAKRPPKRGSLQDSVKPDKKS
jgi:hypothetical protein